MGTIRLFVVIGAIATVWILREHDWKLTAGVLLLYIIVFAVLMIRHIFLSDKKSFAEALTELCSNELKALDYDFSAFDGAADKINGEHAFSLDLDLFGEHSLFQSINRTVTTMGRERLANWFIHPLTKKESILQRQEAVKELAPLVKLRQDFYVNGILKPGERHDDARLLSYIVKDTPVSFAGSFFWRMIVRIVPIFWVVVFVCLIPGYVTLSLFGVFFVLSAMMAYAHIRRINQLHQAVNQLEKILATYSGLIKCIEGEVFTSGILSGISRQLTGKKGKASRAIRKLSAHIGILDQRATLSGILLNIFTFRDLRAAIAIEQWKAEYGTEAGGWLDALAHFDALSSLAGFAFNHPGYIYPELVDTYFRMSGKALGHPLIHREVCVKNDISIEQSPWFMIITGANMAGKSTYLRTVGINFLLACIGAPVCADELSVCPAHLVTSLRTSDSLAGNESYFFAELKRLKMMIDRLQQGEKLFIILDEILKGTNSTDKQKGSLALVKQLLACNACGIIATHDLALGSLENDFPAQIKNYRFEADITGDTLSFSYRLREGIAENMNACFLMQKMGITLDLTV
ncbi:MAG: DNA mismatch repair protein MutS [Tannerellaceae bacterium]|nr:DNA mismatch repair protein MutS [Tannerellaceae bacterium]